jgi:hypothetical protein
MYLQHLKKHCTSSYGSVYNQMVQAADHPVAGAAAVAETWEWKLIFLQVDQLLVLHQQASQTDGCMVL